MKRGILLLAAIAVLVSGCATQVHKKSGTLAREGHPPRVVLMPLDLELSEISAGGIHEPKAEWTDAAQKHVFAAFDKEARARDLVLIPYAADRGSAEDRQMSDDLVKLHRAVGGAVLLHQYFSGQELPSKQGKLDWSLGPEAASIARSQEADYALFLFVRDSYASSGRVAVIVLGALIGVGMPGGAQAGFASLVDLRTGDIVWFNFFRRGSGDLRTAEGAEETVKLLLTDVPK